MQDLTTGSIPRHLLKTTGFMLVTMVFQTLYFLVDLYWVGRLGKEAVAGVAIAGNLTFVVLAITQMLGVGITTLVSHATGQKDRDRALLVFNESLMLSALVGALFLGVGMSVRLPYVNALAADARTAELAADYLLWFIPAMSMQFGIVSMGAALRGTGNFKPGMVVQTWSVILNIVLAPILIFGWGTGVPLGVAGAAISSLVAIAIGTVWLSFYFVGRSAYLKFVRSDWKPDTALWRKILGIGLPAGAEFALVAVYLFVVYAVSRPFGSAAQAGFGIGMRILQAGFMPVVAMGFAVAPVAGQNFGARQPQRVRDTFRSAALMAGGVMVLWTIACLTAGPAMVRVFSNDPQVVAVGGDYLHIVSWTFVGSGVIFVSSSMFQAMGNTLPALMASFVRIVVVAIPAFLLSQLPGFALHWIWYLSVIAIIVQLVITLLLLRREFHRRLNFAPAGATAIPQTVP
jgi:putative MATE family efflux protein